MSIVNDVLDFSKLEAGQIEINRLPAEPRELACDILQNFSPQAEAKSIILIFETRGQMPGLVLMDVARLRQILVNLIGNAVKFTDTGSVSLRAEYSDGRLRFTVSDTGRGIASDQLDKLFQRFSQVDRSASRAQGGTGLGLAICKGLAEAMGGNISVSSRPNEGSTFVLEIPAPAVNNVAKAKRSESLPDISGLCVLVVDDNAANRALVGAVLENAGVELHLAVNGVEAISLAGAASFDLILMDMHMPDMNGAEAARIVKTPGATNADTKILAFTADAFEPTAQRDSRSVFDGVVLKPITPEGLIRAIGNHARINATASRVRHVRRG